MKKSSAEILVTAAMLVFIASCGCDFVIRDVSRTGILGCVAGGLWFWYSVKQDEKSRQPKEELTKKILALKTSREQSKEGTGENDK